jgi:hypothetical protein
MHGLTDPEEIKVALHWERYRTHFVKMGISLERNIEAFRGYRQRHPGSKAEDFTGPTGTPTANRFAVECIKQGLPHPHLLA